MPGRQWFERCGQGFKILTVVISVISATEDGIKLLEKDFLREGLSISRGNERNQSALVTLSGTVESQTLAGLVVDALDTLAAQLRDIHPGPMLTRAADPRLQGWWALLIMLLMGALIGAALLSLLRYRRIPFIWKQGAEVRLAMESFTLPLDRDGMAVVLRNLIGNALKFSRDSASPRIEIGARHETGRRILWVRDNGVGFDLKYHDRIFGIFQRLHRAEEFPGTGVGLALVAKAVQRMGGRVWAESQPGAGATFYLEFLE